MRGDLELDRYEVAHVCGGPRRVAIFVLVALYEDEQIKISSARHRIDAVRRAPRDAIETAALEVIPRAGKVLGPAVRAIANSATAAEIDRRLRDDRVLPASHVSVLWQWRRLPVIRRRRLRRRLLDGPDVDGLTRVAVLGISGITDPRLRRIFQTPDPPPAIKAPKMYVGPVDLTHSTDTPDRSGSLNTLLP
jgi:uncharacterized protein (TIGR04222 family)